MSRTPPNPADEQHRCDVWNFSHPAGTRVTVRKDDDSITETVTESEAMLLGGHTAVVWCKNISGAYALTRVKPISATSDKPTGSPTPDGACYEQPGARRR
jgi:hypothetical protein